MARAAAWLRWGLSPRARGNPTTVSQTARRGGSIPACAGEPRKTLSIIIGLPVYPRVRGGTAGAAVSTSQSLGLSPRARGNHRVGSAGVGGVGSIPACAGEPRSRGSVPCSNAVYPRVRGGTHWRGNSSKSPKGLSPRARGNPLRSHPESESGRSIPACAGEPQPLPPSATAPGVYPRVRGGTGHAPRPHLETYGLSPRARGNRYRCWCGLLCNRSIPACAGEPPHLHARSQRAQVYPRVRGGTSCEASNGLSPA